MDQIRKGLEAFGILDVLSRHKDLLRPYFVDSCPLSAEQVLEVFDFGVVDEQYRLYMTKFLFGDDETEPATTDDMGDLLYSCTGSRLLPKTFKIAFSLADTSVTFSSTCMNQLSVPKACTTYEAFSNIIVGMKVVTGKSFNTL